MGEQCAAALWGDREPVSAGPGEAIHRGCAPHQQVPEEEGGSSAGPQQQRRRAAEGRAMTIRAVCAAAVGCSKYRLSNIDYPPA